MYGLLKRHEVEILLKAGHRRTEIARVTGISATSVHRIAEEAPIEHFNDTAERRKRRIGRPSIVEGSRKMVSDILEKKADLPSLEILRQVRKAGYSGGKTALYDLVASLRRIELATKRNEAFEWTPYRKQMPFMAGRGAWPHALSRARGFLRTGLTSLSQREVWSRRNNMGAPRIAVSKISRLAALHVLDKIPSISSLAKIIRVAKSTVVKYRGLIKASGYSFSDFAALLPGETDAIFDQRAMRHLKPPQRYAALLTIFPQIQANLSDGTENLRQGWAGYKTHHPEGYEYSQFAAHFRSWRETQGLPTSLFTKWLVPHITQEDMDELKRWRRSNDRTRWAKAVVVVDSQRGIGTTNLSSKVEKSCRTVKSWIEAYKRQGMLGLRANRKRRQCSKQLAQMEQKRHRIIEILHETPQIHGINRASWSLKTLAQAFEKQCGQPIGKSTVSEYVIAEGYTFKKARRVLTSPDPNYREKLQEITRVLSTLRDDEKFFSIDEFGPFSVRMRGGVALTPKGTVRVVPQRQRSKGRLIVTAALELSTNQITHFFSEKKNTAEMIRLLDILLQQYSNQRCLYLSWDAASWHVSSKLNERVSEVNSAAQTDRGATPFVKLLPLPASAQFLNVIESVFSGMAKAILHNSDYQSVEDCKAAIDRYFAERNEAYRRNPKRAGKKIWGEELVEPCFTPSNNCKDPNWR